MADLNYFAEGCHKVNVPSRSALVLQRLELPLPAAYVQRTYLVCVCGRCCVERLMQDLAVT